MLERERTSARVEMARALKSERCTRLLGEWGAFLEVLVDRPVEDRPDAMVPLGELAGRRVAKVYRAMVKAGSKIDHESSPEAFHELRKQGKELRYLLELFAIHTHRRTVVKPMIKTLKALQDVLGRHQDREIQIGHDPIAPRCGSCTRRRPWGADGDGRACALAPGRRESGPRRVRSPL